MSRNMVLTIENRAKLIPNAEAMFQILRDSLFSFWKNK